MAINCAHFDFPACVFTEKNMFMKDRHTGAGREGSGRVSAFKATGLLYSYTLECNFNTGRLVNGMPMASRDSGRATPPIKLDHPPKYDPEIYEGDYALWFCRDDQCFNDLIFIHKYTRPIQREEIKIFIFYSRFRKSYGYCHTGLDRV